MVAARGPTPLGVAPRRKRTEWKAARERESRWRTGLEMAEAGIPPRNDVGGGERGMRDSESRRSEEGRERRAYGRDGEGRGQRGKEKRARERGRGWKRVEERDLGLGCALCVARSIQPRALDSKLPLSAVFPLFSLSPQASPRCYLPTRPPPSSLFLPGGPPCRCCFSAAAATAAAATAVRESWRGNRG